MRRWWYQKLLLPEPFRKVARPKLASDPSNKRSILRAQRQEQERTRVPLDLLEDYDALHPSRSTLDPESQVSFHIPSDLWEEQPSKERLSSQCCSVVESELLAISTHLALVPSPGSTRGGPQEWNVLSHFIISSTLDSELHAQLDFLYDGCRPKLPQGECT